MCEILKITRNIFLQNENLIFQSKKVKGITMKCEVHDEDNGESCGKGSCV
jgi:hypothetical protein